MFKNGIDQSIRTIKNTVTNTFIKNRQTFIILFNRIFNRFFGIFCEIRIPPSMKMLRKLLGIHFTTRVAPTTVRREHNNGAPKFWVDTDGETENTTTLLVRVLTNLILLLTRIILKTFQKKKKDSSFGHAIDLVMLCSILSCFS